MENTRKPKTAYLGHTDTRVADSESLVLLVRDDADKELLAAVQLAGVGEREVSVAIESRR